MIIPLQLALPSADKLPVFLEFVQDFHAHGEPRYAAALRDPDAYLQRLASFVVGVGLPPDRVPETSFWALRGDQVVAVSRLRHRLTPRLEQIGGHIAYEVRPSARRQGIGTQLLALTLAQARQLGLRQVLITCDVTNLGSAQVIVNNGGLLEDERVIAGYEERVARYWIAL